MANAREIQSRIKSIKDTRKITNAMYLISSTKLKKSRKLPMLRRVCEGGATALVGSSCFHASLD